MTDSKDKKDTEEKEQQSHRRKSIEEQAEEISDVKLPPIFVIVAGIVICLVLIFALIKLVPGMLNKDEARKYISTKPENKDKDKNKDKNKDKIKDDNAKKPKGDYKIVKAPANPRIKIVTNMGDMTVELYEDKVPNTVANFVELCQKKFYDDIRFHRIIKGFMIQVGCPFAKGRITPDAGGGDAGYKFADEIWSGQSFNEKGLLAMANSGPDTNGSQIFIMHGNAEWLNAKHTIFGEVIEGLGVVDEIASVSTGQNDKPLTDVYIKSTQILQLRDHEYKVKKLGR